MSVDRELFGGAIIAKTALDLTDASDLRQVPDNQEVFMYPNFNISIVVEILQKVDHSHFNDAIRFHFDSLAHDNSARSSEVQSVSVIPNDRGDETPSVAVLKGVQYIPKFNHTTPDKVEILMGLYRVESKGIDLVVTFNVPLETVDGGAVDSGGLQKAEADFDTFVRSLRILDFDLFA
ncbi:Ran guanine nucleotide release factor [Psilocybe cubensis]|uniref:Ran guanine nucleotide release factor n=2 Tax=Psilocybe cubensis TaxID=181762 RepID=A0A8H7Y1N5_PSICU|nr:Ran guanine nucleotide release factor [Psilocybe cubensis]KAH9483758.1 Ran guanine nucleotide release factor [Psilocybe cubensis]